MKLVDDWKKCYKWLSVIIPAIGTAALGAWMVMPDDLRQAVPHRIVEGITALVFVAGVAGRLIKQPYGETHVDNPDS